MSLPVSVPISLLEIKNEFGGPGNLLSYYKGGSHVPNSNANINVPSSGTIELRNFLGANAIILTMTNGTIGPTTNGYSQSASVGSLTPTTIKTKTILGISTDTLSGLNISIQSTTNPGQSFFGSIGIKGLGITGPILALTDIASYSYTGTSAQWSWSPGVTTGNTLKSGGSCEVSIAG